MAHHQPTNVEVENKVAFFVQLNALLTRVISVVSSDALSSAQKAKLSDVRSATEAWLKDVGVISAPRPFIAAAPPPPPPPPLRSSVTETPAEAAPLSETVATSEQQDEEQAEAALTQAPEAPAAEQATATTSSAADGSARASASPAKPGGFSTTTAAVTSTHERADGRKLVGLVSYLRLLFDSDVPERAKLQEFGKSLVRLLMVRCCSTIMASLQHVVHHTYIGTTTTAEEEGDAEAALSALFVQLAKEIDVATKALLGCVRLITSSAVLSEAASARFPVQLCVDVVKQTRRAQVYFQSRVEREEIYLLRTLVTSSDTAAKSAEGSLEDVDAVHDALESVSPERVAAHVLRRVEALRRRWGPSLVHSIRNIGDVIEPSVKFLATVATVRAEGAPAPLVALKKDAAHDLFSLCEPVTATTTAAAAVAAGGQASLAKSLSTCDSPSVVAAPVSASSATPLAWRAAAGEVLICLGSSFSADYLAAVAACCGDSNEGELLATRLLTDMLKCVAAHDLPLLRCVLLDGRWYRALYGGILNCVSSSQPAVLAAGLDALGLLTTACPVVIGREVGLLYSNVVLRLLESANTPRYVKRTIVLHFVTTFMGSGSTLPADGGGGAIPLILHLYRLYDLNVHAHQLNLMQQLTSALSRIVRAAPKEEFMQDAVVQEQLRIQQEAAPSAVMTAPAAQLDGAQHRAEVANGTTSSEPSSLAAAALNPASLSLPAMALHGLVRIVELLTTQTPPEEESGKDVLASLPAMTCRESKLKEQQEVDRFNAAPKKAIYKLFNVTAEENAIPASHADFSSQWEHSLLPPLTSAAAAKVEAVADFLNQVSSLNPEAVAEFLTTPEVFPLQVCRTYLRRLPLAGCSVLEAISELLMRVQLPKEGQRIERLLEYFSAAYYEANRGHGIDSDIFPFKSDTAVFIVVVATVMLNTNIHNPSAGMRLDAKAFRGQLRRCNDDESFADSFVDDIFDRISTHPLESIKSIAADANASTDSTSRGSFDMFFVSQEEKRQLAFGVERQRMVSETRQLLKLRTQQESLAPAPEGWWCAVAKDFFLSTWSSVCAVFGPAMYEGTTAAPSDVLLQCVRGLQSLLCMAAAFDLPTECTVTLLTLLRMADATPVKEHCRRAVLVVAATTYAVNFPVRCWVAVCQIILEVRRTAAAATPPLVEDVFTRIEGITRLSVETEARRASDDSAPKTDRPTEAIHRVVEGITTTISSYAVGDVANLSSALAVLRRALEYTRIVHAKRRTDVVYFVNVRDFTAVVAPAYVELMKKHSSSDDGLQVLFECLVDLLCTMWVSYSTSRVMVTGPGPGPAAGAGGEAETAETLTVDTAPADFAQSFRFLRSVYDVTLASASDGAATLLQMHTLQAIKEVLSRTVRMAEMTAAGQHLSLYTMMASWQEMLYPLAVALCDRNSTAVEAGSLALLVLRKLVALCGGTGTASSDRLPGPVRAALLWLLAQLAYMGGMCGDADSAQVCVALLSSICTTTVAMSVKAASSSSPGCGAAGPASPVTAVADPSTVARLMEQRNALTQQVVTSIEENPHYVVQCTLARLCLLLRCEREQTRAEVMHQLRTLSLQMRPAQLCPMALDLAEVVLEGTIGHAACHREAPRTQSSLIPFLFFQMPVPASMRRCSRTSFRATVPAALGFLANELLTGLSGDDLATAAESVMRRCLLPILLSPNSPHQCRFIAVRSLSQCISVCLPQNSTAPSPQLAQCVLDCLAMALYAVRVPLTSVVSPDTSFVGRRWLDAPATSSASGWAAYCAQATHTVELMDGAEPQWLVRGATAAAADAALSTLAATATEEGDGAAATPTSSHGVCATSEEAHRAGGAAFVPDEALVEYVGLLAQMLAGVPKELQGVVANAAAAAGSATPSAGAVAVPDMNTDDWKLPRASVMVLLQLCLQAGGTLFAVLWRVNHPHEVEQYALQSVESRREAQAFTRKSGLLPHAAIRSVLQCYLKLAVLSTEYPSAELLEVTTDIIEGIRQVQAATHAAAPTPSPPSLTVGGGAGAVTAGASNTSLAADSASLQRLPPQEQQHVRTCNSGMYQQLSVVLGYLVRLLTGQSTSMASVAGWARRQEAFEAMALHPQFFSSLVSLLTPTAGTLIITVRDYFAWYIAHAQLPHQASEIAGPVTVSGGAACSGEVTPTSAAESDEESPSSSQLTALNGTQDGKGSAFGSYSVNGGGSMKLSHVKAARTPSPKPSTVGMARMRMTEGVSDVAAKNTRNLNSE